MPNTGETQRLDAYGMYLALDIGERTYRVYLSMDAYNHALEALAANSGCVLYCEKFKTTYIIPARQIHFAITARDWDGT